MPAPDTSSPARSGRLQFHGRGTDLFSKNGLLMVVCFVSIIGMPYAFLLIWRWLAAKTETANGNRFTFKGGVGMMYALFGTQIVLDIMLQLLAMAALASRPLLGSVAFILFGLILLVRVAIDLTVYFFYLKYFVTNVVDARGRKIGFAGKPLAYVGYMLLIVVATLSVIGWAWAQVAFYRWICRGLRVDGLTVHFRAAGLELLWRTLVYVLFCVPVVTFPWAIVWLKAFIVRSVEIEHGSPASA